MEKVTSSGNSKHKGFNSFFKVPPGEMQVEDLTSLISYVSEEANRLLTSFNRSMPGLSEFVRKNWKPMTAAATLGLTAYGVLRARQPHARVPRSKRLIRSRANKAGRRLDS